VSFRLADRVRSIVQSDIRRYSAICAELGGVNLSQGVCDQPAADQIKAAAKAAIDADRAVYTNLRGIIELRRAIADKLRRFNGIEADPESQVTVTVGSAGAFACAALATLNPGDACVVFSPYYSYHVNLLAMIGVEVQYVDLAPPDLTYATEQLEAAITDRTRMILVNTPANPSGKVFSEAELTEIVRIANQRDLWIATDEIYEYITYEVPHVSPARLPGAKDRTITISGASKTYAVTGWRIGYAAGPSEIIEKMAVVSDTFYICAPAPLQDAVVAGLNLPDSYYVQMREEYRAKRDLLADTLRQVGFEPFVPAGSYYMLAAFGEGRYRDATHAADTILQQVGVATVPAPAFYRRPQDGRRQLRFCYAKQMEDLQEACRRLCRLDGPAATTSTGTLPATDRSGA
jgi:aminotransferase